MRLRWNEDLHVIEESLRLMLTNHLQEAEDPKPGGCGSGGGHKDANGQKDLEKG